MKAKERKTKLITFFTCFLLLIALLVPVHFSMADDHGKKVGMVTTMKEKVEKEGLEVSWGGGTMKATRPLGRW